MVRSVCVILGAIILIPFPAHAVSFGEIAGNTFGPAGPGAAIIQVMMIAVVGWLTGYITSATGKGQIAGMIHVVSVFSCITIVAGVAWSAIKTVGKIAGVEF